MTKQVLDIETNGLVGESSTLVTYTGKLGNTITGRFSSTRPNFEFNAPRREPTDEQKRILHSIDYSIVEARVLAHLGQKLTERKPS